MLYQCLELVHAAWVMAVPEDVRPLIFLRLGPIHDME